MAACTVIPLEQCIQNDQECKVILDTIVSVPLYFMTICLKIKTNKQTKYLCMTYYQSQTILRIPQIFTPLMFKGRFMYGFIPRTDEGNLEIKERGQASPEAGLFL